MSRYKASMSLKKEQIDRLYQGSIDMHVHVAPDPDWDRRLDTYETAQAAEAGGMRAFVAKSFYYPTTTEARIVTNRMEQVQAVGSVTIGYGTTGGRSMRRKQSNIMQKLDVRWSGFRLLMPCTAEKGSAEREASRFWMSMVN